MALAGLLLWLIVALVAIVGCLLFVAGVIVSVVAVARKSPKFSWLGGSMIIGGLLAIGFPLEAVLETFYASALPHSMREYGMSIGLLALAATFSGFVACAHRERSRIS